MRGNPGIERTLGRSLFGSVSEIGFRFDYHEGSPVDSAPFDLGLVKPGIQIWLNLEGQGVCRSRDHSEPFDGEAVWFACRGERELIVDRGRSDRHRFLTLRYSLDFLRHHLPAGSGNLHNVVQSCLGNKKGSRLISDIRPLTPVLKSWVRSARKPPVLTAARPLWYRAKALELASDLFFEASNGELFCHRQQRLAETRAAKVKEILESRLTEPPSLKELGRLVGCSPYYLSRTFSQEAGMTIPQFVRQRRMERAADLLREGRLNVTEVALEVGYNSISHFSQAFCQTMGCCPAMFPLKP